MTVIKLLGPTNQTPGPDPTNYLYNRQQCQQGSAHFIEIDPLRGGPRLPLDGLPACD